jgi:hypothetical protein
MIFGGGVFLDLLNIGIMALDILICIPVFKRTHYRRDHQHRHTQLAIKYRHHVPEVIDWSGDSTCRAESAYKYDHQAYNKFLFQTPS